MQLTGRDLHALVAALKPAIGGKVQKVYGTDRFALVLDCYARDLPYRYFYVELPSLAFMHAVKVEMPTRPRGFAQRVRGQLQGLRIAAIEQHGSDRILVVRLEGRRSYTLVLELFGKGNLVVLDDAGIIRNVFSTESYGSRQVRPGASYVFPPERVLPLDRDGFARSLAPGKHLVAQIAAAGFGGELAERLLASLVEDVATATPEDLEESTLESLRASLGDAWEADRFRVENDRLVADPNGASVLEALASSIDLEPAGSEGGDAAQAPSTSKRDRAIEIQSARLGSLEERRGDDLRRGELLFERYQAVEEVLSFCRGYRAEHGSLEGLDEAWPAAFPPLVSFEKKGLRVSIDLEPER